MRVLMTSDTIGGVWRFTQELASGLLSMGCEVALVSLGAAPSCTQSAWARGMETQWSGSFSFSPADTPLEWMEDNNNAYEAAAPFLLRIAKDFRADVIHSNQYCFGALGEWHPTVVTAHSDVLSWAVACQMQSLEQSAWLLRYCSLVNKGLAFADAVTAPTQWMLDALSHAFKGPLLQRVIPNGRLIQASPSGTRRLQVVTAGRLWDPAKNWSVLQGLSSIIPVFAAGKVLLESEEVPLSSGVRLLGELTEGELLRLFFQSAVYVCTSNYEPFGLAPLEAALCGCAVVSNDLPSLREVWGEDALYFSDCQSLKSIFRELCDNPAYLAHRQRTSHAHARTFTRERMSESYLTIYKQVVSKHSSRRMVAVA